MSINSRELDNELYKKRKEEAMKEVQEMIQNAEEGAEKPVSDEEFKKLAEENLKNERNSLEWWQFIKRTKMYVGREKLLQKEIKRLKVESHNKDNQRAEDLKKQLLESEDNIVVVNLDRTPIK